MRSNLKSMDDGLAPYPFEAYRSWFSLSNHITGLYTCLFTYWSYQCFYLRIHIIFYHVSYFSRSYSNNFYLFSFSISNFSEKTVERLRPKNQNSRISGQAELITLETEIMEKEGVSAFLIRHMMHSLRKLSSLFSKVLLNFDIFHISIDLNIVFSVLFLFNF